MITNTGTSVFDLQASAKPLVIREIGMADLKEALIKGIEDFKENPSHLILLFFIYPIVMLVVAMVVGGFNILPLVFPLLAGFALIGPIAAIGLYELSRRREQGVDIALMDALASTLRSPSIGGILMLSVLLMVLYFAWLGAALAIYWGIFGNFHPGSVTEFARQVLTTPAGWTLIVVGSGVGFLFAAVVLATAAVSFPILLDRNVSAWTAVETSVRAAIANPMAMAVWGLIVAVSLIIGALPLFVGLSVVMPVLGHSTWHLYRKLVSDNP